MNTKKLQHVIDIQLFITILRSDYLNYFFKQSFRNCFLGAEIKPFTLQMLTLLRPAIKAFCNSAMEIR